MLTQNVATNEEFQRYSSWLEANVSLQWYRNKNNESIQSIYGILNERSKRST
jgi:hypothetical protein